MIELEKQNSNGGKNSNSKLLFVVIFFIVVIILLLTVKKKPVATTDPGLPEMSPVQIEKPLHKIDEGRDSLVSLSFLGFDLEGSLSQAVKKKGLSQSSIVNEQTSFGMYSSHSRLYSLTVNGHKTPVDVIVKAVNDSIAHIGCVIHTDIHKDLCPVYEEKYGKQDYVNYSQSSLEEWNFRNQNIRYYYERPQRVLYHPELKKNIYCNFWDFKSIQIDYSDYALDDRLKELEKAVQDIERQRQNKADSIKAETERKAREAEQAKDKLQRQSDGEQI